jgi:RimJ/RimL family protein N-acetyltransferase
MDLAFSISLENEGEHRMLLQYCFEEVKVLRVQYSIGGQNVRSQKAVERIGAVKEGVFRKHRIKADGCKGKID